MEGNLYVGWASQVFRYSNSNIETFFHKNVSTPKYWKIWIATYSNIELIIHKNVPTLDYSNINKTELSSKHCSNIT